MEKKKKIIIIATIIVIILVALIAVLLLNRQENNDSISKIETTVLDISQVFDIDDIEKSKYEMEKAKDIQISSKYIVGSNIYRLNAKVEFMEDTGEMLYVRESYNKLNIYQEEQKIDEYDNVNSQVEGIIENFESKCKSYLGINEEEKGKEELSGESTSKGAIPIGESIYYENRKYSKSYELEEKTYEMNFYKKDTGIVCELVYEIK